MKKLIISYLSPLVVAFALLFAGSCKQDKDETVPVFEHNFGSFTDTRDGHVYKTIKIGTQTWLVENLVYEGVGKEITDNSEWENNDTYDGWCYYENDKGTYGSTYGLLYQWEIAKVACPEGWHLPAGTEWNILRDYLGGYLSSAGGKLKETGTAHWSSPNTGATNETGFTALPGGVRDYAFRSIYDKGYWWCSTQWNPGLENVGQGWSMSHDGNYLRDFNISFDYYDGLSVRCLKD